MLAVPPTMVFPAELAFEGERPAGPVKAVIGSRLRVWRAEGRDIVSVLDVPISASQRQGRRTVVTLTDGRTVTVFRAGGCGCGSSLKRFNPPPE